MSNPRSPKSEIDPISMGDHEDQLSDTGGGDTTGGGNMVVQTPPQPPQFRVHREQGKSFWQLQGLLDEESRTLEIIKQGVVNNKRAITRSNEQ